MLRLRFKSTLPSVIRLLGKDNKPKSAKELPLSIAMTMFDSQTHELQAVTTDSVPLCRIIEINADKSWEPSLKQEREKIIVVDKQPLGRTKEKMVQFRTSMQDYDYQRNINDAIEFLQSGCRVTIKVVKGKRTNTPVPFFVDKIMDSLKEHCTMVTNPVAKRIGVVFTVKAK